MSKKQKQINRLKSKPNDFTFAEIESLLFSLGFKNPTKAKQAGQGLNF